MPSLGWNFKTPLGKEKWKREEKGWFTVLDREEVLVNDRGERKRMVKSRIFLMWAHGLQSGATGQTGDSHRPDRWPPLIGPVSP
jgi:hypothetical protein